MLIKKYFKSICVIFGCACFFINAQLIMNSVRAALIVCYEKVIPSLFLFMVFSAYIAGSNLSNIFALPLKWYCKLIKIDHETAACYLSLSLLGGFAVGAKFLNQLKSEGYDQNSLTVMSIALLNNSISFVAFGVGIGMMGNYRLGLMMFASLCLASLITAFIFSFFYEYNIVISNKNTLAKHGDFQGAVRDSVQSIITICGFVIIFYCLCEVILLYTNNLYLQLILCSLTEVTSGCVKAVGLYGKSPYLLCIVLSVFPISTLSQVKAFAKDGVFIKPLLISRLIHTPLSLLILSLFINFFPVSANVYSNSSVIIKGYWNSVSLSSTLFFIALIFILFIDKNKVFTNKK